MYANNVYKSSQNGLLEFDVFLLKFLLYFHDQNKTVIFYYFSIFRFSKYTVDIGIKISSLI